MKKIGLLVLALVLALGALGTGYALWWDNLYIDAYVYTGDIGLELSQGVPYDTEAPEKDVSWGECYLDDNNTWMVVYVYNAYPCIEYHFPVDIHCTGSVPVHTRVDYMGGTLDQSWITLPTWGGLQIHPGEELWDEIVIHLDNSAAQGEEYYAYFNLVYWQYNEDGP
jgi:hypothetical protein